MFRNTVLLQITNNINQGYFFWWAIVCKSPFCHHWTSWSRQAHRGWKVRCSLIIALFQISTEFKMFFKYCPFQLFNQEAHPCQQSNCPSQLLKPYKWHCAVEAWWGDRGIIKEIQIFNCLSLSFDIETNSMRKCLLKLFSLLQKKSSSHNHSNIQIARARGGV